MDVAALGVKVTSDGIEKTTSDLTKLTAAATSADKANDQLAAGAKNASASTDRLAASTNAVAGSMTRASQSGNAVAGSMNRVAASAKAANDNTGRMGSAFVNAGFQVQDFAVQVASGQSALTAFTQQFPQLLGSFGFSGKLALWGAGIGTLAAVALAIIPRFFDMGHAADAAAAALEKQAAAVRSVNDELEGGIPAISAYADVLERAQKAAELNKVGGIINEQALKSTQTQIDDARLSLADLTSQLQSAGEESGTILQLENAFSRFASAAADGSLKAEEVKTVQDALSEAISSSGIPALTSFAEMFNTLATAALQSSDAVTQNNKAIAQAQSLMNDPRTWRSAGRTDQFGADGTIQGGQFPLPDIGPSPGSRPLIELEGLPKVGRGSSASTKQSAYDAATKSIENQTRALTAQNAAQASLNPSVNDYGFALAQAKAQTDLLLAAEKDKKAITPTLTSQINDQATAYANAVVEQKKMEEATKQANETMNFWKSTTLGAINTFREGMKSGEGFWKSFGSAAESVLDRITDKLLNDVMDAVFKVSNAGSSSGGGGFLSQIFGGLFGGGRSASSYAGLSGGLFAKGGTFQNGISGYSNQVVSRPTMFAFAKGTGLMGEAGPEAIMPLARDGNGRLGVTVNGGAANNNAENGGAGGQSSVLISLSPELVGQILEKAQGQSVKIVQQNEKNKRNLQQNGQAA